MHYFAQITLLILLCCSIPVQAENSCNPIVSPVSSDTTLINTLMRLADKYDFKLTVPTDLDRPVQFNKSMNLDRLIEKLTSGLNTVLKHKKFPECENPVLTHIIVLPIGKDSEYLTVNQTDLVQSENYIYIDDMEKYAVEVLQGNQAADEERMTPEQREEFNFVLETLKAQLAEDESEEGTTNSSGDSEAGYSE